MSSRQDIKTYPQLDRFFYLTRCRIKGGRADDYCPHSSDCSPAVSQINSLPKPSRHFFKIFIITTPHRTAIKPSAGFCCLWGIMNANPCTNGASIPVNRTLCVIHSSFSSYETQR